jgi:hypothetical protein
MAYDSKCLDLAQYFLGVEGDDGDATQASLAQSIQDAVEDWFAGQEELKEPCLTPDEQKAQGARCGCRGADDYCGCQNRPDAITRDNRRRALAQEDTDVR